MTEEIIKRQKATIENLTKQLAQQEKQIQQLKTDNDRNWRIIKELNAANQEYKHAVRQANKALSSLVG